MDDLWFYRPHMKLTAHINFKSILPNATSSVQRVCSHADASRRDLLTALGTDPEKATPDACGLTKHVENYLSILSGGLQQSVLQDSVPSSWSDSLAESSKTKVDQKDIAFEYGNMLVNCALWHAKRAAYIVKQKNASPSQLEASMKEAYLLLRTAAGMLAHIERDVSSKLKARAEPFTDLDGKTLQLYQTQFLAEAQEIALKRSIDAKQASDVICPLAADTAKRFGEIAAGLQQTSNLPKTISRSAIEKWRKYGEVKRSFWQAISRCYQIEMLLAGNQASQALKCVEDAKAQAAVFSDQASKNRSDVGGVPDGAFHLIAKLVERTASKCHSENVLLHHAKAAAEMPALMTNAQYGLAVATQFDQPPAHPLWAEVLPPNTGATNNNNNANSSSSSCSLM